MTPGSAAKANATQRREEVMPKFMIEVDHEAEAYACARTVQVFLATGSHYLTHADWGCFDGVHTAWIVVEEETREQARSIVPPAFRAQARIVALNKFTQDQIDEILRQHGARPLLRAPGLQDVTRFPDFNDDPAMPPE
jgi:hypothetical protein